MQILVQGLSHRTAPLNVRERVAFAPDEVGELLESLGDHDAVAEAALLSTCNRTELYVVSEDPENALRRTGEAVRAAKGIDLDPRVTYTRSQRDAVEHLFRVSGGIDSMVLGETEILGQVKSAFELAAARSSVGVVLGRLFPAALRVGKRARTETGIGRGPVSLPKAALHLAERMFGDLSRRRALVVGAGAAGTHTAELLQATGARRLVFANRTVERARQLAQRFGGRATGIDSLRDEVRNADVVVAAVRSPAPVLTRELLGSALEHRERGPLLVVDLGLPRNVEPTAGRFDRIVLYALDDLQELVDGNLGRRRREVPAVRGIVRHEATRFFEWMNSLRTAPVVVALREKTDRVREESIARMRGLSPEERKLLERFSVSFMNRLLHSPTVTVRECDPETAEGLNRLDWTQRLFGLEPGGNGNGRGNGG